MKGENPVLVEGTMRAGELAAVPRHRPTQAARERKQLRGDSDCPRPHRPQTHGLVRIPTGLRVEQRLGERLVRLPLSAPPDRLAWAAESASTMHRRDGALAAGIVELLLGGVAAIHRAVRRRQPDRNTRLEHCTAFRTGLGSDTAEAVTTLETKPLTDGFNASLSCYAFL